MQPVGSIFIASKIKSKRAGDPEVRALLRQYLHAIHKHTDTVVLEELGLCQGDVRVDVASVNREFSGFEIKSPSDTLARFPKQRRIYSRVVDRAWLVAPIKTLEKAQTPQWWGQIAVFDSDDKLALRVIRPSALNPSVDALSIAKLLWHDEAIAALKRAGHARGVMSKSRKFAWDRIVEMMPLEDLRATLRAALKNRPSRIAQLAR
ncbi:MAG: sce7726 family protein [Acidobacteriota bacterium]